MFILSKFWEKFALKIMKDSISIIPEVGNV